MPLSLPPHPHWEQLRKQAKDLLKTHGEGDASCCRTLRRLKQFEGKGDGEMLAGPLSLVQAQYALAMEYGFASWEQLKRHVDDLSSTAGRRIDPASVRLHGNGWEMDSFCLAMQEALRLVGTNESYETLLALTLNAFAPGFDTGNDCKELWVCHGWVSHVGPLHIAWRRLGVSVEPVSLPAAPSSPADASARQAHREECARRIALCMERGDAVVITGGWKARPDAWVEPWWAGIVTQAKTDGTLVGAHLNGRSDNEIADIWPGEVFAVRRVGPASDEDDGIAAVLRAAITRLQATGEHFAKRQYCAFGVDAMDEWIGQMQRVAHFCPVCQAKSQTGWKSALKVARAVVHRSGVAARFLRGQRESCPRAAQSHLDDAAARYDRICQLLAPAISGPDGDRYETFIGDLPKQDIHAETVLRPIRDELLAIADRLEQAAAAM